eukprot:6811065-Prymnesium_polylepis.1
MMRRVRGGWRTGRRGGAHMVFDQRGGCKVRRSRGVEPRARARPSGCSGVRAAAGERATAEEGGDEAEGQLACGRLEQVLVADGEERHRPERGHVGGPRGDHEERHRPEGGHVRGSTWGSRGAAPS